jgi:hypothetical protein
MENPTKEQCPEKEKIFQGTITVFYKKTKEGLLFLVAENTETGNISFVSGAKEDEDQSLEDSAQRENTEELGSNPDSYQVFISDLTNADFEVSHTEELKSLNWMTEKEVLHSLTFPDMKEVFEKTVKAINP